MDKYKIRSSKSLKLYSVFLFFVCLSFPFQAFAQDVAKKDIASYGGWTVTINYQNAANPTCQIWSDARSGDMKYGGLITIWRDYKTSKEFSERICIEVGVLDLQKLKLVSLDVRPVHQFGNKSGVFRGVARDQEGMIIFTVDKFDFKKMIEPPNQALMAIAKDKIGNEITIGASLEGIQEACAKCGIFD